MYNEALKERINEWIENEIVYQSQERWLYLSVTEYDDSYGWGRRLRAYLDKPAETLRIRGGLLLSGPKGCGKHTAAYHAVKYLCAKYNGMEKYECVFLSQEAFSSEMNDVKLIYEYINSLLDHFEGRNLCLVVEDICNDNFGKELLRRLGQFACMFAARDDFPHLFLIIITEDESVVPSILRERLMLCRMSYPNLKERLAYLSDNYDLCLSIELIENIDVNETLTALAEQSEGMNYAQLRDLVDVIIMEIESEGSEILGIVGRQLPEFDKKELFYQNATPILNSLPTIIQNLCSEQKHEVVVQKTMSDIMVEAENAEKGGTSKEDFQAQIDEMTGNELSCDIFGKEDVDQMLEQAKMIAVKDNAVQNNI